MIFLYLTVIAVKTVDILIKRAACAPKLSRKHNAVTSRGSSNSVHRNNCVILSYK